MENGMWWASQAQGLIHEVAGCQEVVATIIRDAEAIIGRLSGLVASTEPAYSNQT
jgi:nitronate monooxygenase